MLRKKNKGHFSTENLQILLLNALINFIFQRLVVCLEESLFIHNIRDMKVLHTIRETPPNKNGLCALSIDSDHCYLAYPGHSSVGELQIFDALHLVIILLVIANPGSGPPGSPIRGRGWGRGIVLAKNPGPGDFCSENPGVFGGFI